jgi:hypothetical protein
MISATNLNRRKLSQTAGIPGHHARAKRVWAESPNENSPGQSESESDALGESFPNPSKP